MNARQITLLAAFLSVGVGAFVAMSADRPAEPLLPPGDAPFTARERPPVRGFVSAPAPEQGAAHRVSLAAVVPEGGARVDAAVSRLAAALVGEPFDRFGWERRTRAVAASLGEEATPHLLALAGEPGRTDAERIVSAELLRARSANGDDPRPGLAPLTREVLREAVRARDGPEGLSVAAGRALSALGERADREYFLRVLSEDDDAGRRSWASWSLRAAGDDDVAFGLLELVRRGRAELALGTLDGWIRARIPGSLDPAFAATAAFELEGLVLDPDTSPGVRRRALTTLGSLGSPEALATIRTLLATGEGDTEGDTEGRRGELTALVELGTRDSVSALEELILDPEVARSSPLLLAEAWSRLPSECTASAQVDEAVRATLLDTVRGSSSAEDRRRALFALGREGTAESAAAIAEALRSDPAPAVRAAAVWGLARGPDLPARIAALTDAGAHDESPQVRRLARHALSNLRRQRGE